MNSLSIDPRLPMLDTSASEFDRRLQARLYELLREILQSINEASAGRLFEFSSVTGTYAAGENDHVILVAPTGICSITLPSASRMRNKRVIVKRSNNTTHTITILTSGGNIDGAASVSMTTAYQVRELFSDGSNYWLL